MKFEFDQGEEKEVVAVLYNSFGEESKPVLAIKSGDLAIEIDPSGDHDFESDWSDVVTGDWIIKRFYKGDRVTIQF